MLIRTHLLISLFFALIFFPYVKYPYLFLAVALLATYIPDIDTPNSKIGNHWYLRPFQWIAGHRGIVHSFTFLFGICLLLVLFIPVLALPFFLGYASHLFADSFTIEGIKPFYPLRMSSAGNIKTGGFAEMNVLALFGIIDFILFLARIKSIF
jgi:inner membrane protein